jgi:tetratricopeptide (TPR) repeat protein
LKRLSLKEKQMMHHRFPRQSGFFLTLLLFFPILFLTLAWGGDVRHPYPVWGTFPFSLASVVKQDDSGSRSVFDSAQTLAVQHKEYDLQMTKGVAFFDAGKYQESREAFDRALSIHPGDPDAQYHRGVALGRLDRFSDAESDLLAVLSLKEPILAAYLDLGVLYYRQKEYQKALSMLDAGLEKNPKEALFYFYQGKVYQEVDSHDIAAARFLKAAATLQEEGSEIYMAALYHAGVSYYRQGFYEDAREAFSEVTGAAAETEMGRSAQKFLGLILEQEEKAQRGRKWSFFIQGGFQYDDNVLLDPEDPMVSSTVLSDSDDMRAVITLEGRYRFWSRSSARLTGAYLFYQSLHNRLDSFNAQVHEGSLTAAWKQNGKPRRIRYFFDYTTINREEYLLSHGLRSTLFFTDRPSLEGWFFYQVQRNDFIDSDLFPIGSNRDGMNHVLGVRVAAEPEKRFWQAGYTVDLEDVRADDWSYVGHRVNVGVEFPLSNRFWGAVDTEYSLRGYREKGRESKIREDNILKGHLGLLRRFSSQRELSFSYSVTQNRSNIGIFDYDRNITSLNYSRRF